MQTILLCLKPSFINIINQTKLLPLTISILFYTDSPVLHFFHHVILISSTIDFRVAKVFDSPLSEGYKVRKFKIVLEVFGKFFCQNKYQIIISTEKI